MFSGDIGGVNLDIVPLLKTRFMGLKKMNTLFFEPSELTLIKFVNGFTTRPEDIQLAALKTIPGLEKVSFFRPGYINMIFFTAQLKSTLETKVFLVYSLLDK